MTEMIDQIEQAAVLRERAQEVWVQIKTALHTAVKEWMHKDPFVLDFIDSGNSVEVAAICASSSITLTFDSAIPNITIAGRIRPLVMRFRENGSGLPLLERMETTVGIPALVKFVLQAALYPSSK